MKLVQNQTGKDKKMDREYLSNMANTVLNQMGGVNRLVCMVGASNFVFGKTDYDGNKEPMVYFRFKMNRKMNVCKVIYNSGMDLYVMQFLKCGKNGCKIVNEFENVYCDQLVELFEETTGLYLRM